MEINRSGISYFPLDVSLDSKMELIEAEFGVVGFGIVVHLLQEIYGKAGYYIEWDSEVALLFSRKIGEGAGVVSQVIDASIRRGMFDKDIYEKYHVLTSRGIQKRYFGVASRRKVVDVDYNILLVDATHFSSRVNINRVYVNILSENASRNEQSKVKESIVKESKVKCVSTIVDTHTACAREAHCVGDKFEAFWNAYPRQVYKDEAKRAFEKLGTVDLDAMLKALEEQKASAQWQKERGRFIPAPARWLKARCWEDALLSAEEAQGTCGHKNRFDEAEKNRLKEIRRKISEGR